MLVSIDHTDTTPEASWLALSEPFHILVFILNIYSEWTRWWSEPSFFWASTLGLGTSDWKFWRFVVWNDKCWLIHGTWGGAKRVGARDSTPLLRISRSISSCWSPSPSWRWFAGLTGSTKSVWSGERTCRRLMHASDRTRPDLTCSGLILRPKITQINLNKASVWLHLFPYIVWQPIATVFLYAAVAGPNTY